MIKLEIEISEADAKVLSNWASISRTFDNALHCLTLPANSDFDLTTEELADLQQSLDRLHASVRNALIYKEFSLKVKRR